MNKDFYSEPPVGDDTLRAFAEQRMRETTRGNVLLRLGRTNTRPPSRADVDKAFCAFETHMRES